MGEYFRVINGSFNITFFSRLKFEFGKGNY